MAYCSYTVAVWLRSHIQLFAYTNMNNFRFVHTQPAGLSRSLIDTKTHPKNFEKLQLHVLLRLLEVDQANSAAGDG